MVQWYKSGIFFFLIFPLYDNKKVTSFFFLVDFFPALAYNEHS